MIFTGISTKGEIEWSDKERLKQYLVYNPGELIVTITKPRKIRSDRQNKYFYGQVLQIISEYTGHSVKEIKDFLKEEFGWTKTVEMGGKTRLVPRSSADLTTQEFELFMTQIRSWAVENGMRIPAPNEPNYVDERYTVC